MSLKPQQSVDKKCLKEKKMSTLSISQESVDAGTSKFGIEGRQWLTAPGGSSGSKSMESLRSGPAALGSSPPTGLFFIRLGIILWKWSFFFF